MQITQIDHLVMTVHNIEASCDFYCRVLGMQVVEFADNRKALVFGNQKINLHEQGNAFEPRATKAAPGTIDLCLLTTTKMEQVSEHLRQHDVEIIEGPAQRIGATGPILSMYFLDPDGNLLEIASPLTNFNQHHSHAA
jgi:catechol 2,3-dioxygenase-like lactoylglutathione lyase family enzyme